MLELVALALLLQAVGRRAVTPADPYWWRWSRVQGTELLEGLAPGTRRLARLFLDQADAYLESLPGAPYSLRLTSTRRTRAEQAALYRAGRSQLSGDPGSESYHQKGRAWDVVLVRDGQAVWDDVPEYHQLGRIGEGLGLRWGGRWRSFQDVYHFEDRTVRA